MSEQQKHLGKTEKALPAVANQPQEPEPSRDAPVRKYGIDAVPLRGVLSRDESTPEKRATWEAIKHAADASHPLAVLQSRNRALERMLEKATVRLGILRDRMEGCEEANGKTVHELSLFEIHAWIEEQRALIMEPSA